MKADISAMGKEDKEALDALITSIVTIILLHQNFEKMQDATAED